MNILTFPRNSIKMLEKNAYRSPIHNKNENGSNEIIEFGPNINSSINFPEIEQNAYNKIGLSNMGRHRIMHQYRLRELGKTLAHIKNSISAEPAKKLNPFIRKSKNIYKKVLQNLDNDDDSKVLKGNSIILHGFKIEPKNKDYENFYNNDFRLTQQKVLLIRIDKMIILIKMNLITN